MNLMGYTVKQLTESFKAIGGIGIKIKNKKIDKKEKATHSDSHSCFDAIAKTPPFHIQKIIDNGGYILPDNSVIISDSSVSLCNKKKFSELWDIKNQEVFELQKKLANAYYMICDMSKKHRQTGLFIKQVPRQVDSYTKLVEAAYQEFIEKRAANE